MSNNRNMTDAELDALFKNADSAGSVPAFDEKFWTEVETMLPAKKRGGGILWWTSGAALVVGIIVLLAINPFSNDVEPGKQSHTAKNNNAQKEYISANSNNQANDELENYSATTSSERTNSEDKVENQLPAQENRIANSGQNPNNKNQNSIDKEISNVKIHPVNPVMTQNDKTVNPSSADASDLSYTELDKHRFLFTAPVVLNDVEVDRAKKSKLPLYTEFAVGYGQSYKRIEFSNNWATQFRLTVGLTKEVPGMQLSAGLAFRAEMPNNLSYVKTETSSLSTPKSYVSEYRGLYSVEFPMEAGGRFGRNSLGLFFVPGIQLGYTGNKSYYENNELISRERESGAISDAKTMTMECGLKYAYDISEYLQFTGSCTFDMVRPFQSTYYQGDNENYPVTFFVGLRRKF